MAGHESSDEDREKTRPPSEPTSARAVRPGRGTLLASSLSAWAAAALAAILVPILYRHDGIGLAAIPAVVVVGIVLAERLARRAYARASLPTGRSATAVASSLQKGASLEEVQTELQAAATQLEQRERAFAERLATFHEWMEFPAPLQFNKPQEAVDASALGTGAANADPVGQDQDEALFAIIEEEAEALFNAIRDNKYSIDGRFQLDAAREDAIALIRRVARLYQPDADEPLLETSLALILRAASRASLQLLVVLEQLPLDIKELNINRLYGYVQTAVKYVGMYQAAKPYIPWASNAYYIGRYAFGANPLALGAWYATGKLGAEIAKTATERLVNQQALQLIHNVVRLMAFEVAQTYSGDFRQRDPNWIYSAELTRLAAALPTSARTLAECLKEVGAVQLRSEYDRVWFYRCLAAGKAAPASQDMVPLAPEQRRTIAHHLERFIERLAAGQHEAIALWRRQAEPRLGIKLGAASYAGGDAAVREALQSLGGFLLDAKHFPDHQWESAIEQTQTSALASNEMKQSLRESPPYVFEYPDLSPGSELADAYVADLLALAARHPERGADVVALLEEVAAFLRVEQSALHQQWEEALQAEIQRRLGERLRGEPPAIHAAWALDEMDRAEQEDKPLHAAYWPATINAPDGGAERSTEQAFVLLIGDHLHAGPTADSTVAIATLDHITLSRQRGLLGSNCEVKRDGRLWLTIEGGSWTRYQRYFEMLLEQKPESP